jgi:hypothetical protein
LTPDASAAHAEALMPVDAAADTGITIVENPRRVVWSDRERAEIVSAAAELLTIKATSDALVARGHEHST